MKVVTEPEHCFTAAAEREFVRVVKENPCYLFFRSPHRAQFDRGNGQGEDLRAPKRKHHHLPVPNVSVAWKCCSSQFDWVSLAANSTTPLHHEV